MCLEWLRYDCILHFNFAVKYIYSQKCIDYGFNSQKGRNNVNVFLWILLKLFKTLELINNNRISVASSRKKMDRKW